MIKRLTGTPSTRTHPHREAVNRSFYQRQGGSTPHKSARCCKHKTCITNWTRKRRLLPLLLLSAVSNRRTYTECDLMPKTYIVWSTAVYISGICCTSNDVVSWVEPRRLQDGYLNVSVLLPCRRLATVLTTFYEPNSQKEFFRWTGEIEDYINSDKDYTRPGKRVSEKATATEI